MILQAIVAPLPAFLITLANAALFGAFWGGALSWFSAMVGAGLCFCIARALGREVVEKLTGRAVLRSADGYFTRFGPQTILVCRLLPFVPFDPVSYAAGLTSLRFWPFMLATGVGQLPATIVYSWAGVCSPGAPSGWPPGFRCFALAVVISIAKIFTVNVIRDRRHELTPAGFCPLILRPQVWLHRRHYGQVLSPIRWWGRIPWLFYLVSLFVGYIERRRSPLDPVLRSLVSARIAQLCHCEFCIDITSMISRRGAVARTSCWRSPTGAAVRCSAKRAPGAGLCRSCHPDAAGVG